MRRYPLLCDALKFGEAIPRHCEAGRLQVRQCENGRHPVQQRLAEGPREPRHQRDRDRDRTQHMHRTTIPAGPPSGGSSRDVESDQKPEREQGDQADAREQHHDFAQVQRHERILCPHGPPLMDSPCESHCCLLTRRKYDPAWT